MINAHQSLERLRQRHSRWWTLLVARTDIALALASEKKFWREHGDDFGWHASESPFDRALTEAAETDYESARKFYEESPIFEYDIGKAKVGAWCWWISVKYFMGQAQISSNVKVEGSMLL